MRTAAGTAGGVQTAALHGGARKKASVGCQADLAGQAEYVRVMCALTEADRKLGAAIALAEINEVLREGGKATKAGRGSRDAARVAAFLAAADRAFVGGRR